MKRYERLLRLLVQTAAAGLGLWIMYTAVQSHDDRPWLYFAALVMMGLPGARAFGSLVSGIGRVMDALRESERPSADSPDRRKSDGE